MKPINEFFRLKFPFKLQDVHPYAIVKQRIEVSQHSKMGGVGYGHQILGCKTNLHHLRRNVLDFHKTSDTLGVFEVVSSNLPF